MFARDLWCKQHRFCIGNKLMLLISSMSGFQVQKYRQSRTEYLESCEWKVMTSLEYNPQDFTLPKWLMKLPDIDKTNRLKNWTCIISCKNRHNTKWVESNLRFKISTKTLVQTLHINQAIFRFRCLSEVEEDHFPTTFKMEDSLIKIWKIKAAQN